MLVGGYDGWGPGGGTAGEQQERSGSPVTSPCTSKDLRSCLPVTAQGKLEQKSWFDEKGRSASAAALAFWLAVCVMAE